MKFIYNLCKDQLVMSLELDNFVVRMIQITDNNILSEVINDKLEGFTNTNSSPILGEENMKYKIMFSDLEVSNDSKFIIFQLSIKIDNKYYNPYLFLPIKHINNSGFSDENERAISYRLFNNKLDFVWMYLTKQFIKNIIEKSTPTELMIDPIEYTKYYFPIGAGAT